MFNPRPARRKEAAGASPPAAAGNVAGAQRWWFRIQFAGEDVDHSRGVTSVTSWTSQPLPSGSLNDAYEP